jgi:hypothetical protein
MQSTITHINANRENAQKSTGPRTPEGKEASKYNNLRHGLASPLTVLPFEDQNEYNELYASFCEEHAPAGPSEEALVKQIADAQWKLRRIEKLEHHVFTAMLETAETEASADPFAAIAKSLLGPGKHQQALNSLARYQSSLNRQFLQSLQELRRIQKDRKGAEETALKQSAIHQILGSAERSQPARKALDLLAADPEAITRYIDVETKILSATAPKPVLPPRA